MLEQGEEICLYSILEHHLSELINVNKTFSIRLSLLLPLSWHAARNCVSYGGFTLMRQENAVRLKADGHASSLIEREKSDFGGWRKLANPFANSHSKHNKK